MGTPEIARTCLQRAVEEGLDVIAVYTKPDAPQNRGMKQAESPVKQYAKAQGIPVYQPEHFRQDETVEQLRALRPDIIAVVAYGKILPQRVLNIPPKGCVNIHASILPALRGSAPVQWAILNGLEETGVTAMYMAAEMDAGDIIEIRRTPIAPEENTKSLMERLAEIGAGLLADTLHRFAAGTVTAAPQDPTKVTLAPMLNKQMSPIDWSRSAREICCHIRGLDPWPVATMELQGKRFRVYQAWDTRKTTEAAPGTPLGVTKTGLEMACGHGGVVEIRVLQADGGKRMGAPDYFRGHPLQEDVFQ